MDINPNYCSIKPNQTRTIKRNIPCTLTLPMRAVLWWQLIHPCQNQYDGSHFIGNNNAFSKIHVFY